MHACVCACVCVCMRVRACVCVCMRVHVCAQKNVCELPPIAFEQHEDIHHWPCHVVSNGNPGPSQGRHPMCSCVVLLALAKEDIPCAPVVLLWCSWP